MKYCGSTKEGTSNSGGLKGFLRMLVNFLLGLYPEVLADEYDRIPEICFIVIILGEGKRMSYASL